MLALLALFFAPDLDQLGSPDWSVRAAATAKLRGTVRGALVSVVGARSPDPEVRARSVIIGPRWTLTDALAAWCLVVPGPAPWPECDRWYFDHEARAAIFRAAKRLRLWNPCEGFGPNCCGIAAETCPSADRWAFGYWIDSARYRAAAKRNAPKE